MDDLYTIPVTSDPKYGLGLLDSDLDTLQLPTLCGEFEHEHLLSLDDPQNFFAFADAGVFGSSDGGLSRASTAATPQSENSMRTTLSADNVSPASDILSFTDELISQDIEAMYHDTTHSVTSGRQSRATSVTWQTPSSLTMGSNNTLTPPTRPVPLRPQSFSYRTHQIGQRENHTPPPNAFFPSPSLQPQTISSSSPFLSPNLHSPMMPHLTQLPIQDTFMQGSMTPNPASYFIQPQSQSLPSQQLQQQLQQQYQQQLQFQQQQQQALAHSHSHSLPTQTQGHNQMSPFYPHHQLATQSYNMTNTLSTPPPTTSNTPSLPNTTGDSSSGYQCFSHGCGGRHFSNWGNLVRHHRERQLRSKAGAKPTCPRCGKGFTRSSARDAHVAGLKCVLGRRRRATTTAGSAAANPKSENQSTGSADEGVEFDGLQQRDEETFANNERGQERERDLENGSDVSRDDNELVNGECQEGDNSDQSRPQHQHEIYQHAYSLLDPIDLSDVDTSTGTGIPGNTRHTYLVPQKLQFEH